jgi:hypothetical protein
MCCPQLYLASWPLFDLRHAWCNARPPRQWRPGVTRVAVTLGVRRRRIPAARPRKARIHSRRTEPTPGLEPGTRGLRNRCSASTKKHCLPDQTGGPLRRELPVAVLGPHETAHGRRVEPESGRAADLPVDHSGNHLAVERAHRACAEVHPVVQDTREDPDGRSVRSTRMMPGARP